MVTKWSPAFKTPHQYAVGLA